MSSELVEHLRKLIQGQGPLSFRDYMAEVLYHPEFGYYSTDRNPIGNEGDFFTSADLDPVFGKILAGRFARMADEIACPIDAFTLVEIGAGKGLLAKHILQHRSFPYIILERSASMRRRQMETLRGLDVLWVDELPERIQGCVFSNEFFDALPVHRAIRRGKSLREIYVTAEFNEVEGELQIAAQVPLMALTEGQTIEINVEAQKWMRRIGQSLERGYHLVIDYGYQREEFYAQPHGTLMCYWRHQAIEDPYTHIGEQDITAHVNFSDLMDEGEGAGLKVVSFKRQMDFLIEEGILDEIQGLSAVGDGQSMQRLLRIKKLILPGNMGERFKVLIQAKGVRDSG